MKRLKRLTEKIMGWFKSLLPKKKKYTHLKSDEEYYSHLGDKMIKEEFEILDADKLKMAYDKAWENRNYEIDKFWSRALYFWGFIAATFVAYTAIITSENSQMQKIKESNIDICILALGVIFSLAWWLVIRGSKRWQENWEKHIDYLEDYVSSPIYKTIYYSGKTYFSVSKISEYMAITFLGVWIFLLVQTLSDRYCFSCEIVKIDWIATLIIVGMFVMIVVMVKRGKTNIDYPEKEVGFIYRQRGSDLEQREGDEEGTEANQK